MAPVQPQHIYTSTNKTYRRLDSIMVVGVCQNGTTRFQTLLVAFLCSPVMTASGC